jgi:hypothetical protein
VRDIDVVVLDFRKGLLVLLHQLVDVHILPFLDLVDLLLPLQVQVLPQDLDLHDMGRNCVRLLLSCSREKNLLQDKRSPFLFSEIQRTRGATIRSCFCKSC